MKLIVEEGPGKCMIFDGTEEELAYISRTILREHATLRVHAPDYRPFVDHEEPPAAVLTAGENYVLDSAIAFNQQPEERPRHEREQAHEKELAAALV